MLLADDIERINWYGNRNLSRKEGRTEVNDLYKWLLSMNRDDDVKKAIVDPDYLDTLLAEYNNAQAAARS